MPCFFKHLAASLDKSLSADPKNVSIASNTTTSLPKRCHTVPISKPITPAPMIPKRFGTSRIFSAPTLSIIISSVNGAGGIVTATEPAANMTLPALTSLTLPSAAVTFTIQSFCSWPMPWIKVTPLALNNPATPIVRLLTMAFLRANMAATSMVTSPVLIP